MTKFTMMVGLMASGKSTIAQNMAAASGAKVFSSDAYREQMFGNAEDQDHNNAVFSTMYADMIAALNAGQDVILDSTNVSRKRRMSVLQMLSKMNVKKICVLVATDITTCLSRNASRDRIVPVHVILRTWKSFNVPLYNEGWDKIEIMFNNYDKSTYNLSAYEDEISTFVQDNPHHSKTLGGHTKEVVNGVRHFGDTRLFFAALLHDNGKRYTKTFANSKGEPTEIAHFFNHAECGAYEALFFLNEIMFSTEDILYVAGIIQYHMRPYGMSTDKAKNKLLNEVGSKMYTDIMKLNDADKDGK